MKKIFSFFIIFTFIFLCITDFVYAVDDSTFNVYGRGYQYYKSYVNVYYSKHSSYNTYNCFEIPASDLTDSLSLYFKFADGVTSGSGTLFYSPTRLKKVTTSSTVMQTVTYPAGSYEVFTHSSVNGVDTLVFTQPSYEYTGYYYLFITSSNSYLGKAIVTYASPEPTSSPAPIPSPLPTSVPSSTPGNMEASPTPIPSLDDNTWWATCFDSTWKSDSVAPRPIVQSFVPSSMSDFSGDSIYNYVYVYPVRIPFRVQVSNFDGNALFDSYFKFDLKYDIQGFDSSKVNYMVDLSTPWLESSDPNISFNASAGDPYGYGFDIFNASINNGTSSEFYYCFNLYLSFSSSAQLTNFGNYCKITLENTYFNVNSSRIISSSLPGTVLDQINQGIQEGNAQDKEFHDQEEELANNATDNISSGVDQITGNLSTWEIIVMPFDLLKHFVDSIEADGNTGFTFPSFNLMGQTLWPSYTFDLDTIKDQLPFLYNSLHVIFGILVVLAFIRYCWKFWNYFFGQRDEEV